MIFYKAGKTDFFMKKAMKMSELCRCMGILCGAFFIMEIISVVAMLLKGIIFPFYGVLDAYLLIAFGYCTYKSLRDEELPDKHKAFVMVALVLFLYFFIIGCLQSI